jgi:hypothetical protein
MRTGLTKKQKTTVIYFDEHSRIIEVADPQHRPQKAADSICEEHPQCCRQTDDDEQGGLTFEIEKGRLSFRLTAPYRGTAAVCKRTSKQSVFKWVKLVP